MTLQFGASLIDDTRSVNYNHNTFIIQATGGQNFNLYLNANIFDTRVDSTKCITMNVINLVTPKAAAKQELLFNRLASVKLIEQYILDTNAGKQLS